MIAATSTAAGAAKAPLTGSPFTQLSSSTLVVPMVPLNTRDSHTAGLRICVKRVEDADGKLFTPSFGHL